MLRLDCSESSISIASTRVRSGGTAVYPTDTVYGLGCDPYNDLAVESVIRIKGREEDKPMPLLCFSISNASKICKFDVYAQKLAERFWPGALTIIVELTDRRISPKVTANTSTVGVRVPNNKCALDLITACGGVLVGTSANRSGSPSPRSADEITGIKDFDILLDGGKTAGVESTVVEVIDAKITILREGQVKRQEIEQALGLHV